MSWMIKNSKGKKDAILTLVVVGFSVVLVKFVLSGLTVAGVTFGELDASLAGAMLAPTLGAYVVRRHTETRYSSYSSTSSEGSGEAEPSSYEDRENV